MEHRLSSLRDLAHAGFDTIIDVRAPSEFAQDHIPGAINLPAFSDEERARVGTIYVQQSAFLARKVGAALLARNVASHLEGPLRDKPGGWQPLVYCWRGGQRSGGVCSILEQIGWRSARLRGGYKSYRRLVVEALHGDGLGHRLVLLDGNTGSGKTDILSLLGGDGVQVLDLEQMAGHRGSLLGAGLSEQPAQKMFESRIAQALAGFDPNRPVLVEAESSKIGERILPSGLWKAMGQAPRIQVEVPLEARAAYLAQGYQDVLASPGVMEQRLDLLRPFCGHQRVDHWQELLREGAHCDLAAGLMQAHYDPGYARSRKSHHFDVLGCVAGKRLDAAGLRQMAQDVRGLLDQL